MQKKSLILLLYMLTSVFYLLSQETGQLGGAVYDERMNFLSDVTVALQGIDIITTTNRFGGYTFSDIPTGIYTVIFSKIGFNCHTEENVHINPNETRGLSIRLYSTSWVEAIAKYSYTGAQVDTSNVSGVYVAGYISMPGFFNFRAVLWKDGIPLILSDNNSEANSVFVYENNIYVVGSINSEATLWVNGEAQTILVNPSSTQAVFVSDNDVYVLSREFDRPRIYMGRQRHIPPHAILLKNGVIQPFLDDKQQYARNSVFVYENDVYIVGRSGGNILSIRNPNRSPESNISCSCTPIRHWRATLWENGVASTLSNRTSEALSVFVYDNDVYVAGGEEYEDIFRATVWINGITQHLSEKPSHANAVYVSDRDVFILGFEVTDRINDERRTVIWKNGLLHHIIDKIPNARSIFVKGNDVYVVGFDSQGSLLWVNGETQYLSNIRSFANSIFVAE